MYNYTAVGVPLLTHRVPVFSNDFPLMRATPVGQNLQWSTDTYRGTEVRANYTVKFNVIVPVYSNTTCTYIP